MKYSVSAFKEYETQHGLIAEEHVKEIDAGTSAKAEKIAKELYDEGGYSSIYITNLGGNDFASRYWNPRVGIEATGKNWIHEFEAKEEK